jgi:hypothetical protein
MQAEVVQLKRSGYHYLSNKKSYANFEQVLGYHTTKLPHNCDYEPQCECALDKMLNMCTDLYTSLMLRAMYAHVIALRSVYESSITASHKQLQQHVYLFVHYTSYSLLSSLCILHCTIVRCTAKQSATVVRSPSH